MCLFMTYPGAIRYLNSFTDYEKLTQYSYKQSFTIERIKTFLKILNNPQDDLKCIHIAGTKGKGSTCAFIAYILHEAQFKVGLYTSPHLSDFRERIRILDPKAETRNPRSDFEGLISSEELTVLVERLKPYIERYNSQSKYGALSFFEVYTALAFMYFKAKKVDFCILETGLGGRLDATNAVSPLIAAVTPVSYEHTQQLGRTLSEIASEKAEIIKGHKSIVISAPQEEEVIKVIKDRCQQQGAILYELIKDIMFERKGSYQNAQSFNINGAFGRLTDLEIKLLGRHQIINATLAVAVVLALSKAKISNGVNLETIKKGLYNTTWPGRFETILEKPSIVLDGAQNLASAQALRETLIENFPDKRIILVLGISQDKDIKGICQALIPISDEVILTQADSPRAADVDLIDKIIRQLPDVKCRITKTRNVKEAVRLAKKKARPEDLILVTGSLFIVGEARQI